MDHAFLIEGLGGEGGARIEHGRGKLALFAEDAMHHGNIGVSKGDGLADVNVYGGRSKGLYLAFLPNTDRAEYIPVGALGNVDIGGSMKRLCWIAAVLFGCRYVPMAQSRTSGDLIQLENRFNDALVRADLKTRDSGVIAVVTGRLMEKALYKNADISSTYRSCLPTFRNEAHNS
ncbi:MAG TPA: hypothetical protein VIW23_10665 [Candidatus Acidoferrum sp.]|jgi:hypothetical protein